MSTTVLNVVICTLALAALAAPLRAGLLLARVVAALAAFAALFLSARAVDGSAFTTATSCAPLFEYDGLSALFIPLVTLIGCATLFGAPRQELTPATIASLLLSMASTVAAIAAQNLTVFTVAWIGGLFAIWLGLGAGEPRLRATFVRYALLGTAPLLAALALMPSGPWARFGDAAGALTISAREQHVIFALLSTASAFRSGLVPLHSWLPALTERAKVPVSVLRFAMPLGPVLMARAVAPLSKAVGDDDLQIFSIWAVLSALYLALVGLVQSDLKRALGFVLTSQSALLLFGVSSDDAESIHGALLGAVASSLAAAGLLLLAAALTARTGTSDLTRLRGQGRAYGVMATLFFLSASATIGLPGGLAFVAEDLLLHGLLRAHPLSALLLLLVTVLNGITLLRLFFCAFQGPIARRDIQRTRDLTLREGLVVALLLASTFAGGLFPQRLIQLEERSIALLSTRFHGDPPSARGGARSPSSESR